MSLYSDRMINHDALKQWVKTLTTDNLQYINIGGTIFPVTKETKGILDLQIKGFSMAVQNLSPEDDWRNLQGILSRFFIMHSLESIIMLSVLQIIMNVLLLQVILKPTKK